MRLSLRQGTKRGLAAFTLVFSLSALTPSFTVAQSSSELIVRVQELENTIRTLTGQVEGLQFQLTQMQELIVKMQDDNEFRFQQLEGGGAGKTEAAPQSGGEMPAGEAPQPATGDQQQLPDPNAAPQSDVQPGVSGGLSALPDDGKVIAEPAGVPMDDLGDSADPLLGQGSAGGDPATGVLGANGVPLDLSLDRSSALEDGDADAQYKAGYDAIMQGDYAFAEEQLRQFIALYPSHPQAPDATNWLGEALLQRGAYDEAADVLLTGFQAYERSSRAPDLLLKLGVALAGAGETDTACRTYFEVSKRYTSQPAAFNQRLADERAKAKCPA
ncbi:MAG: tol-pal system protein YbgF [Hyphomicrobiales bacterium]|nr:MAG: tol-pal system protein YbgF [Hyphomicrobiales bacterium]